MLLTEQGGFIIKPIAHVLGIIMNFIYEILGNMGVVSIGISIVIFTVFIRLCLAPLMFKQNKSSKIMTYIQPEINKVTKKYKGKRDQESVYAQQRETSAIQKKYGVSMTSGCITSLIQMPIFFALYRVIQNIPAYVDKVYNMYRPIADKIINNEAAIENLKTVQSANSAAKSVNLDTSNVNTIIDVLAKFSSKSWDEFKALFDSNDAVILAVNDNLSQINHAYTFFGIDLTSAPGFAISTALIIPILSMVFQYLSTMATPMQQPADPSQQATMGSMKLMLKIMPLFSLFICISSPAGIGIYWATGSLLSFLTSYFINLYFKKCDMEKVMDKCKAKAAKKNAKRDSKGKKSFMERMMESSTGQSSSTEPTTGKMNKISNQNFKGYQSQNTGVQYKKGSLASKANKLQSYNNGGNKDGL